MKQNYHQLILLNQLILLKVSEVCKFLCCLTATKIWNGSQVLQLGYSSEFYSVSRQYTLEAWGWADTKGETSTLSGSLCLYFLSPPAPSLPYANQG